MTAVLPIMVDCPPYSGRLILERCIERFHIANGGTWKKGDGGGQAAIDTARLRSSRCRGCEIGAERKRASGDRSPSLSATSGLSRSQRATKTNRAAAAALKRELIVVRPMAAPHEEVEMVGKCLDCEKPNQRLPPSGICRKCSRDADDDAKPSPKAKPTKARAPRVVPPPESRLMRWVSMSTGIEGMRRRHAEEIAEAVDEIEDFEKENPDIRNDAAQMLKRLVSTP